MQCTTQRVYSKRDQFKTLTSMNIARDHHNRIIHRFIGLYRQSTRFVCTFTQMMWLLSKRTKRVQGWSRQIMKGAFITCNTITL